MNKIFLLAAALVCLHAQSGLANEPPTANAGRDTTIVQGQYYSLRSTVTDDILTAWDLIYTWTRVGGPGSGVEILSPRTRNSNLSFSQPGAYLFELAVSDSHFTVRDTVAVTVVANIPLAILKPAEGEIIRKGTSYTVTWEWSPIMDAVLVFLSANDGLTWEPLIEAPVTKGLTSWVWEVPDSLPNATNLKLKVTDYFYKKYTGISGNFTVAPKSGVMSAIPVTGARVDGPTEIYAINGRRLVSLEKHNSQRGAVVKAGGICAVRTTDGKTRAKPVVR